MTDPARLAVFWHPLALEHRSGVGAFEGPPSDLLAHQEPHPEGPERIANIKAILERGPLASDIAWHDGRAATREEIARFHDPAYLDRLAAQDATGAEITATTRLQPGTWRCVEAAAGTAVAAMEHVLAGGTGTKAYALVRPPGHHAAPAQADGYCYLNNLGIAVRHAQARGVRRIAVVDWDVHHGNGTQTGFAEDPDVLTVSLHMDHGAWEESHPETGGPEEIGTGPGRGANLNVPMPMGSGDAAYLRALERLVLPALEAFAPELLVVAAGQDGNQFDPNGRQLLTMAGYHAMGAALHEAAARHCAGKMLITQEGGYQKSYTAFCTHAGLAGLIGRPQTLDDPLAFMPDDGPGAIDAWLDGLERRRETALAAG